MKDELARKIIEEFAVLRTKTYSYLTDNSNKDTKKSQRHKNVSCKRKTFKKKRKEKKIKKKKKKKTLT